MSDDLFYLVGFDEEGERESAQGAKRLVCNLEGGGKLAIWVVNEVEPISPQFLPPVCRASCAALVWSLNLGRRSMATLIGFRSMCAWRPSETWNDALTQEFLSRRFRSSNE